MQTTVSIPNPIFEASERLSQRLGLSRSELYIAAITAYLKAHRKSKVTAALNRVYKTEASTISPVLVKMQVISVEGEGVGDTTW